MGFNISGVIINKNYKDNLNELEELIGEKLLFDKEITYEEASENWKEDTYCDVYYSENGTLVFLAVEKSESEFYLKYNDTFSFIYAEGLMYFYINYVKNGKLIYSLVESEGETIKNEGELLEFSEPKNHKSEKIIDYLFKKFLGESFDEIELDNKCYRYKFQSSKINSSNRAKKENAKVQKWWQFWK